MVYFRCTSSGSGKGNTVIVTCAEQFAGVAVTIAKIGKSYTKVCPLTAPYVIKFYGLEAGTYTVSATVSGQTYSTEVIVQDVSCVLNYGFTWKTWVDTASQLDSTDYASLSEVLADEEAVRELFLEHVCVDYMAEATSSNADLETIIENDLCAKWINNSDYALDFLGANTVIKTVMDAAGKYGYGEWVNNNGTWGPKGNVPVMTANNAPYGTALVFGGSTASGNEAYKAFDGNDSTECDLTSAATTKGVGYHFANPIEVKRVYVFLNSSATYDTTLKVQYSDDGTNYVDAYTDTYTVPNKSYFDIPANGYHPYWKAQITVPSAGVGLFARLQFYGRELKVSVPTMTSNTSPYGEAIANETYDSGYEAFRAFDNSDSSRWAGRSTNVGVYCGYKFITKMVFKKLFWKSATSIVGNYIIKGSNDGNTWTPIGSEFAVSGNSSGIVDYPNNATEYSMIALFSNGSNTNGSSFIALQFYGKDYSEKEFEVGTTKKWLYDHGLELDTMITRTGEYSGNVITKNPDSIYLKNADTTGLKVYTAYMHQDDLSRYSLARAVIGEKCATVGQGTFSLQVFSSDAARPANGSYDNSGQYDVAQVSLTYPVDSPYNLVLDLSNITQNYWVSFGGGWSGSYATLKELWLE